jgi:hypothetical protein
MKTALEMADQVESDILCQLHSHLCWLSFRRCFGHNAGDPQEIRALSTVAFVISRATYTRSDGLLAQNNHVGGRNGPLASPRSGLPDATSYPKVGSMFAEILVLFAPPEETPNAIIVQSPKRLCWKIGNWHGRN